MIINVNYSPYIKDIIYGQQEQISSNQESMKSGKYITKVLS